MKLKHYLLIFLIIFVISMSNVFAKTNYNESGHIDNFYEVGTGIFNSELTTDTIVPKILTDGKLLTLVADLDNDTINEIIVFDGSDVILYQTSSLNQVFLLELGISGRISNVIIFDIDDDDFPEIIFAEEETELLHFLEYNGTTFTNETTLKLDTIEHFDGQMMVKCGGVQSCLLVVSSNTTSESASPPFGKLFAHGFNKTTVTSGTLIDTSDGGGGKRNFCFSNIRHILYVDYDSDGITEYVFNAIEPAVAGGDELYAIYFVSLSSSLDVTKENQIDVTTDSSFIESNPTDCVADNAGKFFSPPLVFDINAPSSTPEIMMALTSSTGRFAIHAWKSTGSFLDSYPALCRPLFSWSNCATASFLSNLFRIDIFEGNEGVDDVCVVGYDTDNEALDIICGSETSTQGGFETLEITMDTPHNITTSYQSQRAITHVGDYIESFTANEDGSLKDIPEIINSYGVLKILRTGLTSTASIDFSNPQDNTVLIPVDVEKTNAEDFLLLDATNLFYLDDGLSNKPAIITEIVFNPCPINSVLKVNTTIDIFITVTDQNNALLGQDLVFSSVKMYQGSAFEFNNSFENIVSGALQPYQFILNRTITNGNIRIEGWDSVNLDDRDRHNINLNVQANGIEFGDSECTLEFIPVEEEDVVVEEATLTEDADDNAITNSLITIVSLTGLGGTTLWLFGMMVMSVLIWFEIGKNIGGSATLGAIAIFNIIALVLGARLGILSTALVVTVTVISVAIIGIFLGRFLMGKGTAAS